MVRLHCRRVLDAGLYVGVQADRDIRYLPEERRRVTDEELARLTGPPLEVPAATPPAAARIGSRSRRPRVSDPPRRSFHRLSGPTACQRGIVVASEARNEQLLDFPAGERRAYPGMASIPRGTFRMGSNRHYPEEVPAHRVTVSPFRIDRTPVTNRRFREFVEATGYVTVAEIA